MMPLNFVGCVVFMDVSDGASECDAGTRYDESADQSADSNSWLMIEQNPDAEPDS